MKALIVFVALMACSSASVTTVTATPIHVETVRTLDALNATLSVQRFLRNTSDAVSNVEERVGSEDVSMLKSLFEKSTPWLTPWTRRTSSDMFTRLKLNEREADELFERAKFKTWLTHVKRLHPDSPEKMLKEIYSTLESHYKASTLIKLFTVNVPSKSKSLAEELLKVQIQSWVDSKKTDGQVFAILELDKIEGALCLRSPAFPQWVSFVVKRHTHSPEEAVQSLYLFLSSHFKGTWDVLLAETSVDVTVGVQQLRRMQLKKWLADKKSPEEVLKLLQLDETRGEHLLRSPAFPQWVSFFMKYQNTFPNEAVEWLSSFLSSRFKGTWDVLLAETSVDTRTAVCSLLSIQLKKWHADKRSRDDVFKLLGLTVDTNLFKSPLGEIWLKYLYLFDEGSDSEVLANLQSKFGDAVVAKMLYGSSSDNKMAKKLQEAQFMNWKAHREQMPLSIAVDDGDLLLKITALYFDWIKTQTRKARSPPQPSSF